MRTIASYRWTRVAARTSSPPRPGPDGSKCRLQTDIPPCVAGGGFARSAAWRVAIASTSTARQSAEGCRTVRLGSAKFPPHLTSCEYRGIGCRAASHATPPAFPSPSLRRMCGHRGWETCRCRDRRRSPTSRATRTARTGYEEAARDRHRIVVRCASDNTIGRTLKKTFSSRISSSNG